MIMMAETQKAWGEAFVNAPAASVGPAHVTATGRSGPRTCPDLRRRVSLIGRPHRRRGGTAHMTLPRTASPVASATNQLIRV